MTAPHRKECPFCHSIETEARSQQHYGLWHWIQCMDCGARGPRTKAKGAARVSWDQRSIPRKTKVAA